MAIGVFTSLQFLGTFAGAAGGGYLYGRWGDTGIAVLDVFLLGIWLAIARGIQVPPSRSARVYALDPLDGAQADRLEAGLRAVPGVHEARVVSREHRAYLTVDSTGFDEENVVRLISGAQTR